MADCKIVPLPSPARDGGIEAVLATCRIKRLQAMHGLAALLRGLGKFGNNREPESDAASGRREQFIVAELESMLTQLSAIEIRASRLPITEQPVRRTASINLLPH